MTMNKAARPALRFSRSLSWLAIGLCIVYLVDLVTPLRLHIDSIRYLRLEQCMESRCPPDSIGARDYLPYGYTFLLVVLSKLGALRPFWIVLVNYLYLFGGLEL